MAVIPDKSLNKGLDHFGGGFAYRSWYLLFTRTDGFYTKTCEEIFQVFAIDDDVFRLIALTRFCDNWCSDVKEVFQQRRIRTQHFCVGLCIHNSIVDG